MNEIRSFTEAYESTEGKNLLALGNTIKKQDTAISKRLMFVILMSVISMTVLGYFALGILGSLIFFGITVIASFALYYSSKKNMLLKYLTFYRSAVPKLIALAEDTETTAMEIPNAELIQSLKEETKLSYRMCHSYGDFYVGYAKFQQGNNVILQGLTYYTDGEYKGGEAFRELLDSTFEDYTLKSEKGGTVLFIPGIEDYLNGRVEMKDDLTLPALARQYDYYLLGKAFKDEVNGASSTYDKIFHEAE